MIITWDYENNHDVFCMIVLMLHGLHPYNHESSYNVHIIVIMNYESLTGAHVTYIEFTFCNFTVTNDFSYVYISLVN